MELPVVLDATVSSPWYAQGLRFACTQCGNCCTGGPGYVWISRGEIGRLARHLQLNVSETIQRYCRKIGVRYSLKEHRNSRGQYDCVFLREQEITDSGSRGEKVVHRRRTCGIYPVRPLQCRTWPFWSENLATPKDWKSAARHCPGMGVGSIQNLDEIERIRTAKDWPLANRGAKQAG